MVCRNKKKYTIHGMQNDLFDCSFYGTFVPQNEKRKELHPMQITDVKVRKLFENSEPMKAIVSVTFDGQLAVHDIKVIYAKEKYFIVMPSRKNPDGTYRDIVHPINSEFRAQLETAVIDAYNDALAQAEAEAAALDAENSEEEL